MEYYKQETESNFNFIVLFVFAGLFALTLWFVVSGLSEAFDSAAMQFAYSIRDSFLNVIVAFITHAGDIETLAVICVVLVVLPTRVRFGIPVAGAAVVAGLIQYALNRIVERPRPDAGMWLITGEGYSFPSGHANASFVFYLFLMILLRRYFILEKNSGAANFVTVALPLLVAAIGSSRIYLGVHYPTDIIGGWLLGGAILSAVVLLYDSFYPVKNRLTFDAPSWEYKRKRKPWRRPQVTNSTEDLLDFPKNRSVWRRPGSTAKRRAKEKEKEKEEKR